MYTELQTQKIQKISEEWLSFPEIQYKENKQRGGKKNKKTLLSGST